MGHTKRMDTKESKEDVVRTFNSGKRTAKESESDLGLSSGKVYKWRKALQQEACAGRRAFPGIANGRDVELARLRKELANVTEERDILRKAVAVFSKTK